MVWEYLDGGPKAINCLGAAVFQFKTDSVAQTWKLAFLKMILNK